MRRLVLSEEELPYAVVTPYSTWVSEDSFVVQVMVAEEVVMFEETMFEIVGAVVSGAAGVATEILFD